jgi:hypothetical protein
MLLWKGYCATFLHFFGLCGKSRYYHCQYFGPDVNDPGLGCYGTYNYKQVYWQFFYAPPAQALLKPIIKQAPEARST